MKHGYTSTDQIEGKVNRNRIEGGWRQRFQKFSTQLCQNQSERKKAHDFKLDFLQDFVGKLKSNHVPKGIGTRQQEECCQEGHYAEFNGIHLDHGDVAFCFYIRVT